MLLYNISGVCPESAILKVVQDNNFVVEKSLQPGVYSFYFLTEKESLVVASLENKDGMIIGFADVEPLDLLD